MRTLDRCWQKIHLSLLFDLGALRNQLSRMPDSARRLLRRADVEKCRCVTISEGENSVTFVTARLTYDRNFAVCSAQDRRLVVKRNGAGGRWTKIDIAQLEEASNSN
jgi:hypothetical protein